VRNDLSAVAIEPANCQGVAACLAKAGRYARAHLALDAKIASIAGTLSLSLRLLDTDSGAEVGRVADPVSDDAKERAQEIHRMAVQLLAPSTYIGSLTINVAIPAAEVFLDDHLVGTTPLKGPLDGLRAGPHILRVSKTGFADVNQFVDVVYKRNATVSIDLANNTIGGLIVEVESKTGFGSMWVTANVPGVEIRVDGEPRGTTPLSGAIVKVAAGKRRVSFRGAKMAAQVQEIEIKANARVDIAVTVDGDRIIIAKRVDSSPDSPTPSYEEMVAVALPPALAGGAPPPAIWQPGWKFWAGAVAGGLAVVGFGTGSYFGNRVTTIHDAAKTLAAKYEKERTSDVQADQGDAQTICNKAHADNTCSSGRLADKDSAGKRAQSRELLSFGVAGGLALIGASFMLWDIVGPATPTPQATSTVIGLQLAPTDGGAAAAIIGRF